MKFLLDEDVNPTVATVAVGLGLDVVSVHYLGRVGLPDEQQLQHAATEGRILITRNRDDFLALGRTYYATGRSFPGVLIIPSSLHNRRSEAIAYALQAWADHFEGSEPSAGTFDFLRAAGDRRP